MTYDSPSTTGMTSISRIVVWGFNPRAVNPAYNRAPNTPAAPVPELHVDTESLKSKNVELVMHQQSRLLNTSLQGYSINMAV